MALALLVAVFAGSTPGSGGQAQARYSTAQAKMAGHYESLSTAPDARKKKYGRSGSSATRSYKKSSSKKTYKKNRAGKHRYGSKKSRRKAASYSKSNSRNKSAVYKAKKSYTNKKSYTKVAALSPVHVPQPQKSLSGGGVRWVASSGCLNGTLKSVVYQVAAKFGPVTVSSTCRSKSRNARVGGARKSQHLHGNAVDFRVHSNHRAVYAYLKSHGSVGGYKHYGGGLFHIDTGARRTW
ncbi:MAG: hypothetical protein APF80_12740 [Alphaproteobacteria bacterium BRH_c36]|nr:MAG: hypothetical protein APF80_12740 [Alphaproteobacteria bacterium BRH_c36]